MRILFRWIILTLIVMSLFTVAAVAIPRYLVSSSAVEFWAVDGSGAYHYYYDYRTQLLYLDEQWHPNAQIAPNGEYGVIINRGIRSTFIDYVTKDTKQPLGEFPVDIIDLDIEWSLDSERFFLVGRSENGVTIYSFELASQKLESIVEFETSIVDSISFEYDPEYNLLILYSFDFTSGNVIQVYKLDNGERWSISGIHLLPFHSWKEYISLFSPNDPVENPPETQELHYVSLIDNSDYILPIQLEGEIVNFQFLDDERHLLITVLNPDASYIFDFETENLTRLDTDIPLDIWLYSSDESFVFALNYRYVINGDGGIVPWYRIDLETFKTDYLFDNYSYRFVLARNPTTIDLSDDNRRLAAIINEYRNGAYLQITSTETGELIHTMQIPDNRIASGTTGIGRAIQWYRP